MTGGSRRPLRASGGLVGADRDSTGRGRTRRIVRRGTRVEQVPAMPIPVRPVAEEEMGRIAEIDRTEHITRTYVQEGGLLRVREVDLRLRPWSEEYVAHLIAEWRSRLTPGSRMWGAFDGGRMVGFLNHPSRAPARSRDDRG